ncbi:PREDICTED: mitotic spindle-associated MMXD complex subunit MIP18 [Galeopterus variegatus]|uniref:Mitotic spindle-associated MMXD complex subunit MIP18 n=1 Tax=Galeopterus variegatus TaxID=482537 RepID=A0ABM0QVH6_GALVR|nr:PREDICTED: mitotic spindle-associated MMXD complex subunit MIP18 [Galeopterus variegatus]
MEKAWKAQSTITSPLPSRPHRCTGKRDTGCFSHLAASQIGFRLWFQALLYSLRASNLAWGPFRGDQGATLAKECGRAHPGPCRPRQSLTLAPDEEKQEPTGQGAQPRAKSVQLRAPRQVRVQVSDPESTVAVAFTPTIPHCSMATLIGLSIKVKLLRSLPQRFKMDVHITPGTHASEHAVNKQLADKERVAAALENTHLLEVVNQCLSSRS